MSTLFQSARPVWGATRNYRIHHGKVMFQSARPVWGATGAVLMFRVADPVSIRAPRVGRDQTLQKELRDLQFQSARPVWGATGKVVHDVAVAQFQSARPVWGATPTLLLFRAVN